MHDDWQWVNELDLSPEDRQEFLATWSWLDGRGLDIQTKARIIVRTSLVTALGPASEVTQLLRWIHALAGPYGLSHDDAPGTLYQILREDIPAGTCLSNDDGMRTVVKAATAETEKERRYQRKRKSQLDLDAPIETSDGTASLHELVEDSAQHTAVLRELLLDIEDGRDKNIFLAHCYGYTDREIAQALDLSFGRISQIVKEITERIEMKELGSSPPRGRGE